MTRIVLSLTLVSMVAAVQIATSQTLQSADRPAEPQARDQEPSLDVNGQDRVRFRDPYQGAGPRWTGDVLITDPTYDQVKPSIDDALNGDLYAAVEDLSAPWIDIYRSTDDGCSWSYVLSFHSPDEPRNPSLTYATGDEEWVYVAYEAKHADNSRDVKVFRFDPDDPFIYDFTTVDPGIAGQPPAAYIYPEICTDYLGWSYYYPYVTYSIHIIGVQDGWAPLFSRSTNYGLNWSTPQRLGFWLTSFASRPDIAYGSQNGNDNLFILCVGQHDQICLVKSTDFGGSWSTPVQLTFTSDDDYHPRVAAAYGLTSVVVAYTKNFGGADLDVCYVYSTDEGGTWSTEQWLPWTYDDEESVELSVSNYQGRFHAAFWRDYDIHYTWIDASDPSPPWGGTLVVNEENCASRIYARPAVCVNPTKPVDQEACVAWTDFRGTYYDVYFDCQFLVCPGDVDCDGDTDHSDLGILLADWGCDGSGPGDCPGDLDGDFDTDHSDLGILLADWGCGT